MISQLSAVPDPSKLQTSVIKGSMQLAQTSVDILVAGPSIANFKGDI